MWLNYSIYNFLACRSCYACMRDVACGYCYVDKVDYVLNGSCLPADYDNPWRSVAGRCNTTLLPGRLTWGYDFCPSPYSWMPMVGLVLYLIFFAPGVCTVIKYHLYLVNKSWQISMNFGIRLNLNMPA